MNVRQHLVMWTILVVMNVLVPGQASSGGDEVEEVYEPPVYAGERISLLEAIRITLEHVPDIRLQREDVLYNQGVAQEASGQFDPVLVGELSFDYTQQEITESTKKDEQKNRDDLREEAIQLRETEDAAAQREAEFNAATVILDSGGDLNSVTFSDDNDQGNWNLLVAMRATAETQSEVDVVFRQWLRSQEYAAAEEREEAQNGAQDAEKLLKNMGGVPKAEKTYRGSASFELQKQYRSGVAVAPFLKLKGGGTNFVGKPHSGEFGGKGIEDNYKAQVGFRVEVPLGRGRGVESAAAAENAANMSFEASEALVTHKAAASVHQTSLTYWALVGAEEKFLVMQRSLELHRQLLEISQALVRSDRIPRIELARARAREAEAQAMVEQERRTLHQSRLNLARTIGLEVSSPTRAPLALDRFPETPDTVGISRLDETALASQALMKRYDYRAANLTQEAGRFLWRAAKVDQKRKADLEVEVMATGLEEDNAFFPGMGGALGTWVGPSAKVGLSVEWPFANNIQRGRHEQQRAQYAQRRITSRDLMRTIQSGVVLAVGLLREEARKLRAYTVAADYYQQSVEAETEKFRTGVSTLIDMITTEQRQLDAEMALLSSRQRYVELLTTLRFETGTLVSERPGGGVLNESNLLSLPGGLKEGTD